MRTVKIELDEVNVIAAARALLEGIDGVLEHAIFGALIEIADRASAPAVAPVAEKKKAGRPKKEAQPPGPPPPCPLVHSGRPCTKFGGHPGECFVELEDGDYGPPSMLAPASPAPAPAAPASEGSVTP